MLKFVREWMDINNIVINNLPFCPSPGATYSFILINFYPPQQASK